MKNLLLTAILFGALFCSCTKEEQPQPQRVDNTLRCAELFIEEDNVLEKLSDLSANPPRPFDPPRYWETYNRNREYYMNQYNAIIAEIEELGCR